MHCLRILICLLVSTLALEAQTDEEIFEDAHAQALGYLRTCAEGNFDNRHPLYIVYYLNPQLAQATLNNAAQELEGIHYEHVTTPEETPLLERIRTAITDPIAQLALLLAMNPGGRLQYEMQLAHQLREAIMPDFQTLPPPGNFNPPEIQLAAVEELYEPFTQRTLRELFSTYTILLRSM